MSPAMQSRDTVIGASIFMCSPLMSHLSIAAMYLSTRSACPRCSASEWPGIASLFSALRSQPRQQGSVASQIPFNKLRVTDEKKRGRILLHCKPYEVVTNGVRIYESHEPCPEQGLPTNIGKYRITVEAPISTSDQLLEVGSEIRELAEDLDRSRIYACGAPLHPVRIRLFLRS